MFKKIVIAIILMLTLLLTSCKETKEEVKEEIQDKVITVETYVSCLTDNDIAELNAQMDLLYHPLKDAVERYGDDYELSWEGVYATLKFADAKCSFEAYVGADFEEYDWYNNYVDYNDCDVMEYLSFEVIDKVIFDGDGITLTEGISIGMSADEIAEEIGAAGIDYKKCSMKHSDYNADGEYVQVYTTYGEFSDYFYTVVFEDDILAKVEIASDNGYLSDDSEGGKDIIDEAFAFVTENELASFDTDDLTYKGEKYSSYYGSWFYSWRFAQGNYTDYEICVEQNEPHRVYVASPLGNLPILFWCNGQYADPMLSFLGKWRDYDRNDYIEIKSISKEGIVVFDMYTDIGDTNEWFLFENLNTVIDEIPQSLDAYLYEESIYGSLSGEIQFFNDKAQSGCYGYAGDKYYLIDSFIMNFDGSVEYLPRSIGSRIGSGTLPVHIPSEDYNYTQDATWGYMESFGRDDKNADNIVSGKAAGGDTVINDYLNKLYETTDLKYADIEYTYLYDYVFPVNDTTYNVWESKSEKSPHYLYVDNDKGMIIKETRFNAVSKHTKELIWKSGTRVDKKSYANQKFVTLDGKITIDLANKKITKTDAFVKDIEISEISFDTVRENERFMCFSNIGERFALNGYVLIDHTTWGATLHITDSNIPDFDIGVYYLDCETFFLDPSIGVISVPEESDDKKEEYVDDQLNQTPQETKLVIRDFGGKIIGYIYVKENGDKTVKDFYGKILGYYRASSDVTTDFYGKILYRGDASSALLFNNN